MAEKRGDASRLRISLGDVEEGGQAPPPLAAYLVDRTDKLVRRVELDKGGEASISAADLEKAHQVLIGPAAKDHTELDPDTIVRLHAADVAESVKLGDAIQLGPSDLARFLLYRVCVDGRVTVCRYRPWLYEERVLNVSPLRAASTESIEALQIARPREIGSMKATLAVSDFLPRFPWPTCSDVCHGIVEVYARTCCCQPIYVRDPRLVDLKRKLKEIVKVRPPIKWPPPPPPPPIFEASQPMSLALESDRAPDEILSGGTLNEALINAEADLHAIETLHAEAIPAYLADRDYLRPFWCSCGSPVRKGQGTLRPDGTFQICWREPVDIYLPWCHREYAFVVRQFVNGALTVIYNGLVAGQWFRSTTGIHLTTWDWRAIGCDAPVTPDDGTAFVNLERIGGAYAYRLKTPDQDSWDGVVAPDYNSGLLDPAPTALAARGNSMNSNWGGTLALGYHFSPAMRARGASHYRVSVTAADGSGNPTGGVSQLQSGVAWLYYDYSGPGSTNSESLGPVTVGTEPNLYKIPYAADKDWILSSHAYFDTARFAPGRYLVMLEVFNAAGQRLRPTGSSGPGTDTNFQYRHWFQEIGPLQVVPYAALTTMFWCDNRAGVAEIHDLQVSGIGSHDECQFLVGTPTTQFGVTYRAFHPNPMFIYNHSMTWHRGLNGPWGLLVSSPDNAGEFVDAVTPPTTFGALLGPHNRCTFTINLNVSVKTTSGSGPLYNLYGHDQGSFALED